MLNVMSLRNSALKRPRVSALSIIVLAVALVGTSVTADSPSDPKRVAFEAVDRNADAIATVGDVLYYFAEPGMQEYESSKYLKSTLEQIGFKVELGGAGLPTNVWATWGSGKPVILIATEMDALPEGSQTPGSIPRKPLVEGAPGHMEGHNVMAAMSVGAAQALALSTALMLGWPVAESAPVTSPFGYRVHPTLRTRRMHTGVDLSVREGTTHAIVGE